MNTLTTLSIAILMAFAFGAPAHAGDKAKCLFTFDREGVEQCIADGHGDVFYDPGF